MGIFNLFKKKDNSKIISELIAFSAEAIGFAKDDIVENGTFLPFGAVLTKDRSFSLVVYQDPEKQTVDPREHATIIQKLIAKRYQDPKCEICFMAFDGISHLKTGDIDSINVRVSHRQTNIHKLISYTYELDKGAVKILNKENPIITDM